MVQTFPKVLPHSDEGVRRLLIFPDSHGEKHGYCCLFFAEAKGFCVKGLRKDSVRRPDFCAPGSLQVSCHLKD